MAGHASTGASGLKIFLAQREYYRYTGVWAECEHQSIHPMSHPDLTRLQRTTAVI